MSKTSKFKTLPGYSNYRFYSDGSVYSLWKGRFLKPFKNKAGYVQVCLKHDSGQIKKFYHHRILCLLFLPPAVDKPDVNHKNGKRSDNRLENLEWCTASENLRHANDTGLRLRRVGTKWKTSKLSLSDVRKVRKLLFEKRLTHEEIGARFGISDSTVCSINKGYRYGEDV